MPFCFFMTHTSYSVLVPVPFISYQAPFLSFTPTRAYTRITFVESLSPQCYIAKKDTRMSKRTAEECPSDSLAGKHRLRYSPLMLILTSSLDRHYS